MNHALPVAFLLAIMLALASCNSTDRARQGTEADALRHLPLNRVQVIGSHNSYKLAPQPELLELLRPFNKKVDSINYAHLSLTDQLNLGLRNLELDVYHDPDGGRYADPMGKRLLRLAGKEPWPRPDAASLALPGFKVMHDADFDFRSWNLDFKKCLQVLKAWSSSQPDHTPVFITMNTKQESSGVPGSVTPAPFDACALRALNDVIASELGPESLLVPDSIRGNANTLREGVLKRGWPTTSEARGRFVFILDEGGKTRECYLAAYPGLRKAVFFVDAAPDSGEAAIFVINDPVRDQDRIKYLAHQGFLIRTRADADTAEARANNRTRFEAAMSSGAHIITTDYYIPDRSVNDRYMVRFERGLFIRGIPKTDRTSP